METPVLLNVFNRPGSTRKVFRQIRKIKPRRLFISADGPRPEVAGEAKRCEKVREILSAIDWDCDCQRLYREQNLGCAKGVSGGISWFFEHVDYGIILEDDTVPSESFFQFAGELLKRYQDHHKIMHIAGTNITPVPEAEASYLFSRLIHVHGWATWKRAWRLFDMEMKAWPQFRKNMAANQHFGNMTQSYIASLDRCYQRDLRVWGPKWSHTCLANDGLSIIPAVNLVDNIGYGPGAAHTKQLRNPFSHIKRSQMVFPLTHPTVVAPKVQFDEYYLHYLFSESKKQPSTFLKYRHRFQTKIKRIAGKLTGRPN
jgi:hypothetical protein